MAEILSRNVKKETDEQYLGGWPLSADARRNLYLKYAGYPADIAHERGESEVQPINIWSKIAERVVLETGNSPDIKGIDVGSSSGYFIENLLQVGYRGKIIGVDIETGHQPFLQQQFRMDYPESQVLLGGANAQSLREISITDEYDVVSKLKVRPNDFDFLTELFVLYHVPLPERAYDAAHRVIKPGGLAIFSGRGKLNQQHLWNLGAKIAKNLNTLSPESFYTRHSVEDMENYLNNSPKYELIESFTQADNLWIPNNDEGWQDYKEALMSLRPFLKDKKTLKVINGKLLSDYLDSEIRPKEFEKTAIGNGSNGRYYMDYVFQSYFVCRTV